MNTASRKIKEQRKDRFGTLSSECHSGESSTMESTSVTERLSGTHWKTPLASSVSPRSLSTITCSSFALEECTDLTSLSTSATTLASWESSSENIKTNRRINHRNQNQARRLRTFISPSKHHVSQSRSMPWWTMMTRTIEWKRTSLRRKLNRMSTMMCASISPSEASALTKLKI